MRQRPQTARVRRLESGAESHGELRMIPGLEGSLGTFLSSLFGFLNTLFNGIFGILADFFGGFNFNLG
jgi:hypothetical protein